MAAAEALEMAHGQIRPGVSEGYSSAIPVGISENRRRKSGGKWIGVVLGLVLLVFLIGIWGSLTPRPPGSFDGGVLAPSSARNTTGVPMSADAFLQSR